MKQYFTILSIVLFSISHISGQQAWTKEKGKYFAQIGSSVLLYNKYINSQTKNTLPLNRDFVDMSLSLYGEYGITDYLTVMGQIPFKYSAGSNGTNTNVKDGSITGLSNINLALTGKIYNKDGIAISGKVRAGLPTATYKDDTGLRTGFDATTIAPSLLVGIGAKKFFTSAEFGREFRNNGYTNRNLLAWQIGKFFKGGKLLTILSLEVLKSLGTSTYDDANSKYTGLYLSTQSYVSPAIKLGYNLKNNNTIWFSFGAGLPGTDDIPASPGISLSFSHKN